MMHVWTFCCVCKNVVNEIWEVEARAWLISPAQMESPRMTRRVESTLWLPEELPAILPHLRLE